MSDLPPLRAPVRQIIINPITTGTSSKPQPKSHAGVIAGGTIGGVSAFLAIGAITLLVQRRRKRSYRRQSIASSFETNTIAPNWPTTVTPFNQALIGVAGLETGSQMNSQRHLADPVRPEGIPLARAPPLNSPMSFPGVVSFPVGLSSKELARLRAENSRSQSNGPWLSGPTLAATTELSGATSSLEAQRLRSEVEYLRNEMQQLRVERPEAPPDYEDRGS
jgi:hypothetical protein